MNIVLLGGSNAGVKDGWAAQFASIAARHAVENRFLGAVGSLYGLMALLKMERESAALPDLIVFEYSLNDILLREAGVLQNDLVEDALDAVLNFCARHGVGLLFLCLEPRPLESGKPRSGAVERIQKLYAATARRRSVASLWLRDMIGEDLTPAHFQDENHLTTEIAGRVARIVAGRIEQGVAALPPVVEESGRFAYVDATQALVAGPCALRALTSRVFDGTFLEIARGGTSSWSGEGSLAALMLQSDDRSGVYSIRAGARVRRKTARSHMQEIVRNLMLLHYVAGAFPARGDVEIAMPADESALMSLPPDKGLLEASSIAPFDAQTLLINGVVFWRKAPLLARLRRLVARLL
ncbi:hypothetical protein [Methylocystis parvus]|uniref:Uncharacterized protein n=1 Tax=Methylocystis parvus TaxID=134 RepID=A0A6B8LUZ6_9HYPH|nr:hypothetical protein [Methylocystis parvus]QGM96187.1 hypothetical protein F7D14_00900 [Methylocystis parvus]WBJ99987.1 hypothetical protein MMG94_18715 [Methylocystis parvus OBBP]